ncbi:MAG TPA: transcription termination/antitermination NusG family protein [Acidobacteriaceae bacterium]
MATQTMVNADVQLGCYAVKVRAQGEEAVAKALRERGHDVLAPMYTEVRRYSDRLKKVNCALFPGYVFVQMDIETIMSVVSTNGVSYIVRTGRSFEPLSDDDVKTVEALCRGEEQCEPCDYLQVGQKVIIEEGTFAGLTGVLQRVRDENRVVVAVESLHRAVSVAIRSSALRLV